MLHVFLALYVRSNAWTLVIRLLETVIVLSIRDAI